MRYAVLYNMLLMLYREIQISLERSGGTVGQINVTYTGFFLPPDAVDTRDALPGVLMQPTGVVTIEDGEGGFVICWYI